MRDWLAEHWVAGALFMAVALLAVAPVTWREMSPPLLLIYLHAPAYMLHQVEEHADDRFRRFVNQRVFGGIDALTTNSVLLINLPGVWGINLAALYAAWLFGPGVGLAAPYLMLVNAITHIAATGRYRAYNPGVGTALCLFMPLSLATLWAVPASPVAQVLGFAIALAIHGLIALHTARRAARLSRVGITPARPVPTVQ